MLLEMKKMREEGDAKQEKAQREMREELRHELASKYSKTGTIKGWVDGAAKSRRTNSVNTQ